MESLLFFIKRCIPDKEYVSDYHYFTRYLNYYAILAMHACSSRENYITVGSDRGSCFVIIEEFILMILEQVDELPFTKNELRNLFMHAVHTTAQLFTDNEIMNKIFDCFMSGDKDYPSYEHAITQFILKYQLTEDDVQKFVDLIAESLEYLAFTFNLNHFATYCHAHNYQKILTSSSFVHLSKYVNKWIFFDSANEWKEYRSWNQVCYC